MQIESALGPRGQNQLCFLSHATKLKYPDVYTLIAEMKDKYTALLHKTISTVSGTDYIYIGINCDIFLFRESNQIPGSYQLNSHLIASTAVPKISGLPRHDIIIRLGHLQVRAKFGQDILTTLQ